MNWDAIGAIGEILGALAVLAVCEVRLPILSYEGNSDEIFHLQYSKSV